MNHSVRAIVVMPNGNVLVAGVFDEITEQGSSTPDTTKPFIQALTPPGPGGGKFAQWDEHTVDFVGNMAMIPDGRVFVGREGARAARSPPTPRPGMSPGTCSRTVTCKPLATRMDG